MSDFSEFLEILDDGDLEEVPVDIDTFVHSKDYLGRDEITLGDYQRQCILASTQIYKRETLHEFLPAREAEKRWSQTCNEVILQLGKGSGKDFMSAVSCCYLIYLLLCLKDPARYYDKPSGDEIAILNIAINAAQASNVFFNNVVRLLKKSEWFKGRYETKGGSNDPAKANEVNFDKNITLYSGHSERESWEGYNVIMVVLDEIDGFAMDIAKGEIGKTARGIYDMYRASVRSRFAEFGKVIELSWPRYRGSFIQTRYDEVVASKRIVEREETLKLDQDLPDGHEGNEIVVAWQEDHIEAYRYPKIFALKRPTWDVNPTVKIENYIVDFFDNYTDTLARTACMPPDAIDAFFKDRVKVEEAFRSNNVSNNDNGTLSDDLKPDPNKIYFVHVDLARKHDRCAVAMAHIAKWESRKLGNLTTEAAPVIKVDSLRYWIPKPDEPVDFTAVREHILDLARRGYNIRLVTFDQWESADMRRYLESAGLRTDKLSVAIKHYTDFAVAIAQDRLEGPDEKLLREELLALRIMPNGKIDHMRQGYKDLSDATCGAIFNCIEHTPRDLNRVVEVKNVTDLRKEVRNDTVRQQLAEQTQRNDRNVIRAPGTGSKMPTEIADWLSRLKVV